jgi:hypothetical protein
MNENPTPDLTAVDVDELWLREWAAAGLARLERYLANHAAFAEYLRLRAVLESDDGDCPAAA